MTGGLLDWLLQTLLDLLLTGAVIGTIIVVMLIVSLSLQALERRFGWFVAWVKRGGSARSGTRAEERTR